MSKDHIETVKEFYNFNPEIEWNRLEKFRFEFEITKIMMEKHLKKGSILDIGGGPGRYSIHLAKQGNDVTLIDLSDKNVNFAQTKAKENNVDITCYQGDARDLSHLPLKKYDSILIMGPMYHLQNEDDRKKCILEAKRLLKPDGHLFVSFILLHAGLNYYLDECPEQIINEIEDSYLEALKKDQTWAGKAFTESVFIKPNEIEPFFEELGFKKITMFGQEGVTGVRMSFIENQSDEVRKTYLDISLALCENPDYFPYTSHLVYVGKLK